MAAIRLTKQALESTFPTAHNRSADGFDRALYLVSDCLATASMAREQGQERRAQALFLAAERVAVRGGFTELMQLVWAYSDSDTSRQHEATG